MDIKFQNDKHYEERIIQAMIVDHPWAEQMIEVLDLEYFNLEYARDLAKILFDYYKEYHAFPSFGLLASIVKTQSEGPSKEQMLSYMARIKQEPLNGDLGYIKDDALDFCKRRSLLIALESSLNLIESRKYDDIIGTVQKALLAGSDKDVGHIFLERLDERMAVAKRKPIPTPWEEINEVTQGGLSGGELGIIMAATGQGKSHALIDIGQHAARQGYNVVHYTLELADLYVGKRYDSRISEVAFDDLLFHKEKVANSLKNIPGKIVIKWMPPKRTTTLAIKNHINQLILRDLKPDLVVVDYGDLLQSSRKYDQKRLEEETAYEDLRALAGELELPVWTVTQTNREGYDADVLTLKHVAECFGKAMVSDLFITLTRKKEDSIVNIGNMFIAKSRLGRDGMTFPVLVNTSISKFEILDPADLPENGEASGMGYLQKKFDEFKKNGKI